MRRVIATAGIVAVALCLGACSAENSGTVSDGPSTASAAKSTPKPANPKLGQTYTYKDGLAVTVATPTEFTPSDTAFGSVAGETALAFTITIANGTKDNFDPTLFSETVSSGGKESETIMDSTNGCGMSPQTPVLPGKSVTFKVGFSVADPSDITMDVTPDLDHNDTLFTS